MKANMSPRSASGSRFEVAAWEARFRVLIVGCHGASPSDGEAATSYKQDQRTDRPADNNRTRPLGDFVM